MLRHCVYDISLKADFKLSLNVRILAVYYKRSTRIFFQTLFNNHTDRNPSQYKAIAVCLLTVDLLDQNAMQPKDKI